MTSSPYSSSILNTEPRLKMVSSHSPSTSETTKVGPISARSDMEAAALCGVLEVDSLTKSVMYIFQVFLKVKIWLTLPLA